MTFPPQILQQIEAAARKQHGPIPYSAYIGGATHGFQLATEIYEPLLKEVESYAHHTKMSCMEYCSSCKARKVLEHLRARLGDSDG